MKKKLLFLFLVLIFPLAVLADENPKVLTLNASVNGNKIN